MLAPQEGRTYVGREDAATEQDIGEFPARVEGPACGGPTCDLCVPSAVLHGLDLESEHCVFENKSGTVTLVPFSGAQCSVNGVLVSEPSQLNQGEEPIPAAASPHRNLLGFHSAVSPASRRRHSPGQDQHVSLQPPEGSSQTAGEAEGEAAPSCCPG